MSDEQWEIHTVREGTKGPLKRKVAVIEVYVWSAKRVTTPYPEKLRMIISSKIDGSDVKYSLTNDISIEGQPLLSNWELLYRQMQRYWVERAIQDCKDSLGMTDYQVRKWRAWHHHMTLTIMALQYMLEQKIRNHENIPLLSCPDIKFFLALTLQRKANSPEQIWALIQKRHQQRQADLDRYKDLK